jgi:hypothetical protein
MSKCIASISNKMQRYRVYLYLKTALHVSGGTSTHHQKRTQLYLQHLVLSHTCRYRGRVGTDLSVLWVAYATHSTLIYAVSWKQPTNLTKASTSLSSIFYTTSAVYKSD